MAKVKLTIETAKAKRFLVACDIADLKIIDTLKAGDITVMVVNYKHPSQLYIAGLMVDKVSESYDRKEPEAILPETSKANEPTKYPIGKNKK